MSRHRHVNELLGESQVVALVGHVGVGKSTLFEQLSPARHHEALIIPGGVKLTAGRMRGRLVGAEGPPVLLVDTPGIYSVFTHNEHEKTTRRLLLSGKVDHLVQVLDAKNLRRSLVLALQLAEFGVPVSFLLNMLDEAENRGIEISLRQLIAQLGAEVRWAVLSEGQGVDELPVLLQRTRRLAPRVQFPRPVEEVLALLIKLLAGSTIPSRAVGILLLGGSNDAREYVAREFGQGMLRQVDLLIEALQQEVAYPLDVVLMESYSSYAERIVEKVQRVNQQTPRLMATFGRLAQRLPTGIPIAVAIVVVMYYWVGVFGASYLVDLINEKIFAAHLVPWLHWALEPIPWPFLRSALLDESFGVLTTGLFLAFGIVLPILFCFYFFFGLLEESGYLPRFSVLLNSLLGKLGLNGKGLIPLVMGFSCVTLAILTTRTLDTKKEKNIATFLLALGMPCAPLLGVMMVILAPMPWYATAFIFSFIFVQILLSGMLADRLLPGRGADFMMELPPMRVPRLRTLVGQTWRRVAFFMREAVPIFLLAAFVVFLFNYLGGLALIEQGARPVVRGWLGLPDESVRVFIKSMIRRENGATELDLLRHSFTNLQLIVALLVMTFMVPCVNAIIVTVKERGLRTGAVILTAVLIYALLWGGLVNHGCRVLGISFN